MIGWENIELDQNIKDANELEKLSKQFAKAYEERLKEQERAVKLLKKEKMTSYTMERRLDSGKINHFFNGIFMWEIVYDSLEKTALMATEDMKRTQQLRKEAHERKQVKKNLSY